MRSHTRRIVPAMFATTALLLASTASVLNAQIDPANYAIGVYNPNVEPCPGPPAEIQGYASLAKLRLDLASYFSSLTSPPTISPKPTPAPSKSPTLKPTRRPTTSPTPAPTVLPTKAPITFRPTRPPWWKPTVSPAPTIEIIIIGGGGGGYGGGPPSGPSGPSRLLNEEYPPAPSPAREDGLKRLRGHIAVVEGDYAQTDAIEEEGQQQGGDHSLSPQGRSHVASHLVDDGEPVHFPICPGTVFEFTASNPDYVREWNTPEWIVPTALPPLLLETPPRNPVIVACLPDPANGGNTRSCIFSGGTVQLLIDNSNRDDYFDYDYASYSSDESKLLTVSGLTFRGATFTSTLLLDPRSPVSFYDCAWQNNAGRAVVHVNGTYIEPYTTTTSTIDWNSMSSSTTSVWETGSDERKLMSLGDDKEYGALSSGKNEEGASLEGDMAHEGGDGVESATMTMTSSTVFDWGQLETFRDLEEVEDETEDESSAGRGLGGGEEDAAMEGDENVSTGARYFLDNESAADGDLPSSHYTRFLGNDSDKPRSRIIITGCSFSGNTADATIVVSSYSDSSYQKNNRYLADLPHSINLLVEKTEFVSENVAGSLIVNKGGRLKSSSCVFENNSAKSIIKSERGAVELRRAKFSGNALTSNEGIVVLDSKSELDRNEVNCAEGSDGACDGIIISGVCQPFDESCVARDEAPEDTPEPTLAPSESPSLSLFPTINVTFSPTAGGNITSAPTPTAGGDSNSTSAPTPTAGGSNVTSAPTTGDSGNATSAPTPTAAGGGNATSAPTPTASGGSNGTSPAPTPPCPAQYPGSMILGDGAATLFYAVVPSQGGARGILCGIIGYNAEGWIGFGISPKGTMEGGEAIIGLPEEGTVLKYSLGMIDRTSLMPDEKQTLLRSSIQHKNGKTVMQFTKYLKEDGENQIMEDGVNTFLYALGSSNQLGYHGSSRGNFVLDFSASGTASPQRAPTMSPVVASNPSAPTPSEGSDDPTPYYSYSPTSNPTVKDDGTPPSNDGTTKPTNVVVEDISTPTAKPTKEPTMNPTNMPTKKPTRMPTKKPTRKPTRMPTRKPTRKPTKKPTQKPTSGGMEAKEDCGAPEKLKRSKKRCKAQKKEEEQHPSRPTGSRPSGVRLAPNRSPPSGGQLKRSRKHLNEG